jgi:hypothetical protein
MVSRFIDGLPSIGVYQLLREGTVRPSDTVVTLMVDGVTHTLALKRGLCGVLFCCPRCGSARWNLYPDAGTLACRGCLRLGYPQRLAYRIRRLRRQLGASEVPLSPLPSRRGLRGWKALRYDRLTAAIKRAEANASRPFGMITRVTIARRQARVRRLERAAYWPASNTR